MEKISCEVARGLITEDFKGVISDEDKGKLENHCETCEKCRELHHKTMEAGEVVVVKHKVDKEELKRILEKRRKKKNRRIRISVTVGSVLLVLLIFYGITMRGWFTFFAKEDYGIATSYLQRTEDHPSIDDVKNAMELCKDQYSTLGYGTVLLSLEYNDEKSFNHIYDTDNCIVIDFSYLRLFDVEGSRNAKTGVNSTYAFLVEYDEEFMCWKLIGFQKREYIENKKDIYFAK